MADGVADDHGEVGRNNVKAERLVGAKCSLIREFLAGLT